MGRRKLDLLARISKWFSVQDFLHIFGFSLIYNSFFLKIFSKHFSVPTTGLPPILAATEYSHLPTFSSPPSPFPLLFLLPACSSLLAFPVVPTTMHLSLNWLPGRREGTYSGLTSSQVTGVSEEVPQATRLSWEVELSSHCCWSCELKSVYKTFK